MRFLPRDNTIYLAEDGVTEIHGEGYADQRKWWVTFLDPFDLVGMAKGRNMKNKFWETHTEGRVAAEGSGSANKGKGREDYDIVDVERNAGRLGSD